MESSSPAHRPPISKGSPVLRSSAAPQPSDPPCDTHNSMEVIAQLLQEAEGELCARLQRKQLTSVIHNQCLLFQIQMKRSLKMIPYYKSFANNECGLGSKLGKILYILCLQMISYLKCLSLFYYKQINPTF